MTDAPAGQFDSIPSNMDSDHHKDLGHGHPSSSWIEVIVTIISISEMSLSLENQRDFQTISSSCIFKLAFKQQHVENHLPFSFSAFKHFMFFFHLKFAKKIIRGTVNISRNSRQRDLLCENRQPPPPPPPPPPTETLFFSRQMFVLTTKQRHISRNAALHGDARLPEGRRNQAPSPIVYGGNCFDASSSFYANFCIGVKLWKEGLCCTGNGW